jgi:hypothetical protein
VKGPVRSMLHPEDIAKSALACLAFYHVLAHARPVEGTGKEEKWMRKAVIVVLGALCSSTVDRLRAAARHFFMRRWCVEIDEGERGAGLVEIGRLAWQSSPRFLL